PRVSDVELAGGRMDFRASPGPSGRVELQQAVAALESDRREALVLTRMLGLSYAEAAEVCECAVGTIRSRVFRARAELLDSLTGRGRGCGTGLGRIAGVRRVGSASRR